MIALCIGLPANATNVNEKITICHATESESNPWFRIVISEKAKNGHFEVNGTPLAGHEKDIYFDGEWECPEPPPKDVCPDIEGIQTYTEDCVPPNPPPQPPPTPPTPTPTPVPPPQPELPVTGIKIPHLNLVLGIIWPYLLAGLTFLIIGRSIKKKA